MYILQCQVYATQKILLHVKYLLHVVFPGLWCFVFSRLWLAKLASIRVYGSAVIKKRRYWPKCIDGAGTIDTHFDFKEISTTDSLPGTMDGVSFKIHCMKDEDYVMKLIATYGALKPIDDGRTQRSVTRRTGQRENVSFLYTEPFFNHFQYRHQVDDHNNLQHSPISLEESLSTKDWTLWVFSFILELESLCSCSNRDLWVGNGAPVCCYIDRNKMGVSQVQVPTTTRLQNVGMAKKDTNLL